MSIIYEKTPNGLYATGQRKVTTFPSGLIRVDQTFACKTSAAAPHRATLAEGSTMPGPMAPSSAILKIYPSPQENQREDGFTEFICSAFGYAGNGTRSYLSYDTYQKSAQWTMSFGVDDQGNQSIRTNTITASFDRKIQVVDKISNSADSSIDELTEGFTIQTPIRRGDIYVGDVIVPFGDFYYFKPVITLTTISYGFYFHHNIKMYYS